MKFAEFLSSKKVMTDLGIIAVVGLFFVAGIFFESRRSGDGGSRLVGDVGAESVPGPGTATVPGDSTGPGAGEPPAASATATAQPGSGEQPAAPGTPDPDAVGKPIFLQVSGIENESVVEGSTLGVTGLTTPDALLSVNGQAVQVDLDGAFTTNIELEPGPNFVEFVSSNLKGQETSRTFSVVSVQ